MISGHEISRRFHGERSGRLSRPGWTPPQRDASRRAGTPLLRLLTASFADRLGKRRHPPPSRRGPPLRVQARYHRSRHRTTQRPPGVATAGHVSSTRRLHGIPCVPNTRPFGNPRRGPGRVRLLTSKPSRGSSRASKALQSATSAPGSARRPGLPLSWPPQPLLPSTGSSSNENLRSSMDHDMRTRCRGTARARARSGQASRREIHATFCVALAETTKQEKKKKVKGGKRSEEEI